MLSQFILAGDTLMLHHVVAAFIIRRDRVLLGRRSPGHTFCPNAWDVFGGYVEPEEQPVQLVRELQEEHSVIQWFSYDEAIKLDLAHASHRRLFAHCPGSVRDHGR